MLKVEVGDDLGEALLILHRAQADTGDAMRKAASAAIDSVWVPTLNEAASTAQQAKLLASGAGSNVTDLGFDLIAGRGPSLSGGLDSSHWYAVDYGMTPKAIRAPKRQATYKRRGGGAPVRMNAIIWVGRNLPSRNNAGRVIYPAIGEVSQDIIAAWVTGIMEQFTGGPLDASMTDELGQVNGSWR
jgi:hypothetical protein